MSEPLLIECLERSRREQLDFLCQADRGQAPELQEQEPTAGGEPSSDK